MRLKSRVMADGNIWMTKCVSLRIDLETFEAAEESAAAKGRKDFVAREKVKASVHRH